MNRSPFGIRILAPVLLLGLFVFGCTPAVDEELEEESAPRTVSPDLVVVATVNGDPITLGEFNERFERASFKPEREAEAEVKTEFLNRLIERKMMLREAQRRRIQVKLPEINSRIEAIRKEQGKDLNEILAAAGLDYEKLKADIWENMMIEKLLEREVERGVSVSSSEIRRYYSDHAKDFDRPDQVRARQIVIATEAEAVKVLEQIEKGADFPSLARSVSTAPEASNGGDLGYFSKGQMPDEFNVVFTLPKGGTSGVVKSPYGYHIFRLEDRKPAGRRSVDEVAGEIREIISHEKQEKRFRQWMKELRSRTKFEVNYQALDR